MRLCENGASGISGLVPGQNLIKWSSHPEKARAKLLIDRKRAVGKLAMLKGNTEPADIEKLRRERLNPILDRLLDLQLQVAKDNAAQLSSGAVGNSR